MNNSHDEKNKIKISNMLSKWMSLPPESKQRLQNMHPDMCIKLNKLETAFKKTLESTADCSDEKIVFKPLSPEELNRAPFRNLRESFPKSASKSTMALLNILSDSEKDS